MCFCGASWRRPFRVSAINSFQTNIPNAAVHEQALGRRGGARPKLMAGPATSQPANHSMCVAGPCSSAARLTSSSARQIIDGEGAEFQGFLEASARPACAPRPAACPSAACARSSDLPREPWARFGSRARPFETRLGRPSRSASSGTSGNSSFVAFACPPRLTAPLPHHPQPPTGRRDRRSHVPQPVRHGRDGVEPAGPSAPGGVRARGRQAGEEQQCLRRERWMGPGLDCEIEMEWDRMGCWRPWLVAEAEGGIRPIHGG